MKHPFINQLLRLTLASLLGLMPLFMGAKNPVDYNGNPLNQRGGIILTNQTSSATLAGYTQSINFAGLRDNSFGILGTQTTNITQGTAVAYSQTITSMVMQGNKYIVAGYINPNIGYNVFCLARYNADGSLDRTFGTNGVTITDLGFVAFSSTGNPSQAHAVMLQTIGGTQYVVAGGQVNNPNRGGLTNFALARYNATTGLLDTTSGFGVSGVQTTDVATPCFSIANAVIASTITGIDYIVLGGYGLSSAFGGHNVFFLARYNATTGALDTVSGFGDGGTGIVKTDVNGDPSSVTSLLSMTANATNYIVAGGIADANFAFAFYVASTGALDTVNYNPTSSDSLAGTQLVAGSAFSTAMTLQTTLAGSFIVASGATNMNEVILTRLTTAHGVIDGGFGAGGTVTQSITTPFANGATAIMLQTVGLNHYIVAAGFGGNGTNNVFALARYNGADGSVDNTFNPTSAVQNAITTDVTPGANSVSNAVVVQANNEIVAAGYGTQGPNNVFALTRYTTGGTLDNSFGINGIQTNNFGTKYDSAGYGSALQQDGKLVMAGITTAGAGNLFALTRYNTNGSLDTTFGTNGIVTTNIIANQASSGRAVAVQTNGKIVVAGYVENGTNHVFALARYNSNGSLDTAFNPTGSLPGTVTTDVTPGLDSEAYALIIQPNGQLVIAGVGINTTYHVFALARYNSNGSLDTTGFNSTGPVPGTLTTDITPGFNNGAFGVALQSNNQLVAVGYGNNAINSFVALARYNSNGSLDTATFNPTGGIPGTVITNPIAGLAGQAHAVVIQPDGKIAIAGFTHNGFNQLFAVARYNTNGSLDATFNPTGSVPGIIATDVSPGFSSAAQALLLQSDGQLIALGYGTAGTSFFALTRYSTHGLLDTTFGTQGILKSDITPGNNSQAQGGALQPNGNIIAAGSGGNGANSVFAVARYINPFTPASFTASYGSVGLI